MACRTGFPKPVADPPVQVHSGDVKPLLAATAILVMLVVAAVQGGVLSATGEGPRARDSNVRVAATDDDAAPAGNPAARAFVAAKKEWTACVAEAGACGTKPHPHDFAGKHAKKDKSGKKDKKDKVHGTPAWAGGPDHRSAKPPGHAKRD